MGALTDITTETADAPQVDESIAQKEQPYASTDASSNEETLVECPPHTTESKLLTRIDWRVVPCLCVLYLLAFIDRVNIANARSFGLIEDLELDGTKYNTALTIFFVPYIIFEIPSNILLKKFKPHVWLSGCMFAFGLVTMCQGFVQNYGGLITTRFLLGIAEAGMFPGCFYLIGMWYRRTEAQRRYSFFFSSTSLAGAFGGLLASAIGKMDYVQGFRGWRWIFILEGLLTCVVAIVFFFLLPSFPEDAKWLKGDEQKYVIARLQVDQGKSAADRKITLRDVGRCFKDYKIWLGGFMYFGLIVPSYGYAFFAPSIISELGYSPIQTQLRSVPPWACSFALSMIIAYFSDRFAHRFLFTLIPICIALTGFGIVLNVHDNTQLQYAALFLIAMGCYAAMPVIVCWYNMNLGGHHRRSVGSAWQVAFGNIGGIISTFSFLPSDAATYYKKGYSISIGFICLSAFCCALYFFLVNWENKRRDAAADTSTLTEEEKVELGDNSPDYRYLL